jgi:hypothetical protein
MINLPDIKEGDDQISAEWLNALKNEVRRLGKLKVSAPLTLSHGPGGTAIGYGETDRRVFVTISSNAVKAGCYYGRIMIPGGNLLLGLDPTATGGVTATNLYTLPATDDCVILNWAEAAYSSGSSYYAHTLPLSQSFVGYLTDFVTTDGYPIVEIDALKNVLFAVKLHQTTGAAGSKTTKATWGYEIKDRSSVGVLFESGTPEYQRLNGTVPVAASDGVMYLDTHDSSMNTVFFDERITDTWP